MLLAPTRELALQTHRVVKELGRYTDLRTAVLVGGDSMEAQFAELSANPDIIVATPGQLRILLLLLLLLLLPLLLLLLYLLLLLLLLLLSRLLLLL